MFEAVFMLIAGIGIMLYGVKLLSDSLQKLTNNNLKKNINKFTKNRVSSAGFGTLFTCAMQSSTASTIMTVGLTSVGIFSLFQGLGFIVGCNVGSSFVNLLLIINGLSFKEIFASICFVGVLLNFLKNDKVKLIGKVIVGFGLLFSGLSVISANISVINASFNVGEMLSIVNNPVLLILLGALVTIILQSTFGTMALLITLASTGVFSGVVSLYELSFFIYGVNIGTTLTTLIVSLTSNADGKRIALFHLFFNVFGTIIFSILSLVGFTTLVSYITSNFSLQLILVDIVFNLLTGLAVLILLKPISFIMSKMIKGKLKNEETWELDEIALTNKLVAIEQIRYQTNKLFKLVDETFKDVNEYVFNDIKSSRRIKEKIDYLKTANVKILQNSIKMSDIVTGRDNYLVVYIDFFNKIMDKCLTVYKEIIGVMVSQNEKIILFENQKKVIAQLFDLQQDSITMLREVMDNIYAENNLYDYTTTTSLIIECMEKSDTIKNSQKIDYVKNFATKTGKKHYVYFVLMNKLQNVTNYLSDLAIECLELNSKYLLKVGSEENEKNVD